MTANPRAKELTFYSGMTEPIDDSSAIDCLDDPLRELSEKFYGMGDVIKGYGTG